MKTNSGNLHPLPPSEYFALPLQARAGLYATLRDQPGLPLQSKIFGEPFQTEVDPSTTNT